VILSIQLKIIPMKIESEVDLLAFPYERGTSISFKSVFPEWDNNLGLLNFVEWVLIVTLVD
jgi:hypothetical protein